MTVDESWSIAGQGSRTFLLDPPARRFLLFARLRLGAPALHGRFEYATQHFGPLLTLCALIRSIFARFQEPLESKMNSSTMSASVVVLGNYESAMLAFAGRTDRTEVAIYPAQLQK